MKRRLPKEKLDEIADMLDEETPRKILSDLHTALYYWARERNDIESLQYTTILGRSDEEHEVVAKTTLEPVNIQPPKTTPRRASRNTARNDVLRRQNRQRTRTTRRRGGKVECQTKKPNKE